MSGLIHLYHFFQTEFFHLFDVLINVFNLILSECKAHNRFIHISIKVRLVLIFHINFFSSSHREMIIITIIIFVIAGRMIITHIQNLRFIQEWNSESFPFFQSKGSKDAGPEYMTNCMAFQHITPNI